MGVDRGNIYDSFSLINALRKDGGGGTTHFKVDEDIQYDGRLLSHRGKKEDRQKLLEQIELEGVQSLYQMTYGGQYRDPVMGAKLTLNTKGKDGNHPCREAYDSTYFNTYQLVKKLREDGGGGTSIYHVAPKVRKVEREYRIKDQHKHMNHNHETDYPRSNVTGISHVDTRKPK